MTKTKLVKRVVDSYTIKGTNKVVKAGDCVMIQPHQNNVNPYVARVEKIEAYNRDLKVRLRWYYWPEEAFGGRRKFHGAKELFLSDHYGIQSAHTINGKCIVHSFKDYTKLQTVGVQDFYCRFEYKPLTGAFSPERVAVYCKCEMPYNPDDLMIQSEECNECDVRYLSTGLANGKQLKPKPLTNHKQFVCSEPSLEEDVEKTTALTNGKGEPKRQRK